MSAYKLLALDMDGTLLTSDKRISPRTLAAIRDAASRGIVVALSTGRAINELAEYREMLSGAVRYASLLSGGCVCDLETGQTIGAWPIDLRMSLAVAEVGLQQRAMVHVLTTKQTAANPRDIERMPEVGMGVYQEMFRKICTPVDDICTFIAEHSDEVCKINLYHKSPAAREQTFERLQALDVQVVYAETTSIECTAMGVTKAQGLELLCRHVGCTIDECIAMGDSSNDSDAMRAAGFAVAMGNATEDILALADAVVADNDHDGITEAIERWLS